MAAFWPRCKAAAVHASTHVTCRHQLPCNCVLPPELHLAYPFDNLLHQGVLADAVCTSAAGASPLGHRSRPQQAGSHQKPAAAGRSPARSKMTSTSPGVEPRFSAQGSYSGEVLLVYPECPGLPAFVQVGGSDPGSTDAQSSKVCRVADHTGMGCHAGCHWLLSRRRPHLRQQVTARRRRPHQRPMARRQHCGCERSGSPSAWRARRPTSASRVRRRARPGPGPEHLCIFLQSSVSQNRILKLGPDPRQELPASQPPPAARPACHPPRARRPAVEGQPCAPHPVDRALRALLGVGAGPAQRPSAGRGQQRRQQQRACGSGWLSGGVPLGGGGGERVL